MSNLLDATISVFRGVDTGLVETISLATILERIRTGTYRESITRVRQHKATPNLDAYKAAKEHLISFTPCCALTTRKKTVPWEQKLVSTTGLVQFDFDGVPDPEGLKRRFAGHPATVFAFVSPGGDGLKVGLAAEGIQSVETYRAVWEHVLRRLKKAFPEQAIKEDEHVKFLHALCFVSDDPCAYVNADAVPLVMPTRPPDEEAPAPEPPPTNSPDFDLAKITGALTRIPSESYDSWIAVGQALHSTGHPLARGLWDWWSARSTKYDPAAQGQKWASFTRDGGRDLGHLYTLAHQCGWRPAHEDTTPAEDAHERRNGHSAAVPPDEKPPGPRVCLITAEDVKEEPIPWLWEPYIPRQMVTLVDGDPGVGKTMFGCQLAANVTKGHPMPDQTGKPTIPLDPGHVLMVAMEDLLGAVVRPRLRRCGADLSKITFVLGCEEGTDDPRPFTLADLPLLADYMQEYTPRLVYIDAIQAVLGPKIDINRANAVTAILGPLKALAERYDCAIVCNRHPAKPGQNAAKLLHRGLGSQAFVGTIRAGLFVEEYPGDDTKALLIPYKSNVGKPGRTQLFSKADGVFSWLGASRITHTLLAGSTTGPQPLNRVKAALWLERYLRHGVSVAASTIYQAVEAADLDYSKKLLRQASEALGVQKAKVASDYLWSLPPLSTRGEMRERTGETRETGQTGETRETRAPTDNVDVTVPPSGTARVETLDDHESLESLDTLDCLVYPVPTAESVDSAVNTSVDGICTPTEACIHEHVGEEGCCNDCGMVMSNALGGGTWASPPDEYDEVDL